MATTLVLMRHAHACLDYDGEDFYCPLSTEGRIAQRRMNLILKEHGYVPDLILCSPFLRTKQTAELIAEAFGCPVEEEPLVGQEFDQTLLMQSLQEVPKNSTLFIVGHEPTLRSFIEALAGWGCLTEGLCRCGAVAFVFPAEVGFGLGKFSAYLKP